MVRRAVFPGSFDPITNGHVDVISRTAPLFDELIVLVGKSERKDALFSSEERRRQVAESVRDIPGVKVDVGSGLTVEYAKNNQCGYMIRGLRGASDADYELGMATMNKRLNSSIETIMVFSCPELVGISSSLIKEVVVNGGSVKGLVPEHVEKALIKKCGRS
jgi:pantetheine-phosphate adenylyltransferase